MSKVKKSVVVDAPVEVVYGAWHNFENFPHFMDNIEEVRVTDALRSHWKARGPLGTAAEWDAEMTLDERNQAIGWRSAEDASLKTAGRVNFRDEGGRTAIDVTIEYDAPGGVVGEAVTKIFANPEKQVEEDLRRFKETIEKGAELSGLKFDNPMAGDDSLGGSMGAVSEEDLTAIAGRNTGIAPDEVDDPARREA